MRQTHLFPLIEVIWNQPVWSVYMCPLFIWLQRLCVLYLCCKYAGTQVWEVHTLFMSFYLGWVELIFYSSYFDINYLLLFPDSLVNSYIMPLMLGLAVLGNILSLLLISKLIGLG